MNTKKPGKKHFCVLVSRTLGLLPTNVYTFGGNHFKCNNFEEVEEIFERWVGRHTQAKEDQYAQRLVDNFLD